jgi:hypothetical protein
MRAAPAALRWEKVFFIASRANHSRHRQKIHLRIASSEPVIWPAREPARSPPSDRSCRRNLPRPADANAAPSFHSSRAGQSVSRGHGLSSNFVGEPAAQKCRRLAAGQTRQRRRHGEMKTDKVRQRIARQPERHARTVHAENQRPAGTQVDLRKQFQNRAIPAADG